MSEIVTNSSGLRQTWTHTCHFALRDARTLGQSRERFFCTHPSIHAERHLVTPAICRRCPESKTTPFDKALRFPFNSHEPTTSHNLQLVVAHYREDLTWLRDCPTLSSIVYSKSGAGENPLPNVGREAHTYLHHIICNYDRLASLTVFLQGHPLDHVPDLLEKIWGLTSTTDYLELSDLVLVDDANGRPAQPGLPLARFCQKLLGASPSYFQCRVGACFAVSRELIHSRSLAFYQHAMELVLTEDRGPWCIERLWHLIFQKPSSTEGIVTASDSLYFRDLQFLIRSLAAESKRSVCVIDLGFTESQRNWCLDQSHVQLWSPPGLFRPMQKIYERFWWQAWIKPFYLIQAPFDRVLWIDADSLIIGSLDDLFEQMRESAVMVRDGTTVRTENDPRLYEHLTLPPQTRTAGVNVNSGVVGLCKIRDRNLLSAWAWASQWISTHPDLQSLSAWADQGLLLWALHATGNTHLIQQTLEWNQPVFSQPDLLASAVRSGRNLVRELKLRFPDASVVHFLGPHKLSRQLDEQVHEIFFANEPFEGEPQLKG